MKKIGFIIALLFGMIVCIAGTSVAGQTVLEEILASGKMKVSVDANYAPASYLNDTGDLEGFDISVAKEVAKRLGVKIEFITPDWDLITAGKWGKRWDVSIGSMTRTAERKKALLFSMPYYAAITQFAIHKDNTTIKTLSDLAGKKIGVMSESTNERYLLRNLNIDGVKIVYQTWEPGELRTYPTDANHIEDLSLGDGARLDAIFSSRQTLAEAIQSGCGKGCPLKMIGESPFFEPLCFALDKSRPNSETLLVKLNDIIQEMYADGTLVKLSMHFFNANLIPKL